MDRIVKIGIIGCGGIANGKHLPALKKLPNVQMVAFCDIIKEKAEQAAKVYGTPDAKVFTDYHDILKMDDIEVVHVLTPNRSHSFITVDALEAGKHVMCEKPMAINAEEAKKMVDAAKRTGKSSPSVIRTDSAPILSMSSANAMKALSAIFITQKRSLSEDVPFPHGACSSMNTSRAAVLSSISVLTHSTSLSGA